MHGRTLVTTLAAATLGLTAAGLPSTAAAAAPPAGEVHVLVDMLPCQSDPEPFEVTFVSRDRLHERPTGDRHHENSASVGTFTAVPVRVDELTGALTPRAGSTWTGRTVLTHTGNDGTAGAGHAVSTFRLRISASSDSGARLHQQLFAHYTGTARPDDDSALVRRFFAESTCH